MSMKLKAKQIVTQEDSVVIIRTYEQRMTRKELEDERTLLQVEAERLIKSMDDIRKKVHALAGRMEEIEAILVQFPSDVPGGGVTAATAEEASA